MDLTEPTIVGKHRYRVRQVQSGVGTWYQPEWQRDYNTLRRRRLRTRGGTTVEILASPPWESSWRRFANEQDAAAFAIALLATQTATKNS